MLLHALHAPRPDPCSCTPACSPSPLQMGYLLAGLVDLASGAGLVEQQESFLGKLALHICVFGILLVRSTADLDKYKNLLDEATFYDKQWNASWDGVKRPSETEQ